MPHVHFTRNLASQTSAPSCQVEGATVAEALQAVFQGNPKLRGYIVDDQGALRTHVVVFVDGTAMRDRSRLSDMLRPDSEIFVMQALSGG
jgi:sulfur-carrier protein